MKKYYFTFGSHHIGPIGTSREGKSLFCYYVTVEAENMAVARGIMFARYKDKWAFCYQEHEFQASIGQFSLTEYEVMIQEQTSKTA